MLIWKFTRSQDLVGGLSLNRRLTYQTQMRDRFFVRAHFCPSQLKPSRRLRHDIPTRSDRSLDRLFITSAMSCFHVRMVADLAQLKRPTENKSMTKLLFHFHNDLYIKITVNFWRLKKAVFSCMALHGLAHKCTFNKFSTAFDVHLFFHYKR